MTDNRKHKTENDPKKVAPDDVRERDSKVGPDQTRMPWEQDPERRLGNFEGKGEPSFKQPGKRQ